MQNKRKDNSGNQIDNEDGEIFEYEDKQDEYEIKPDSNVLEKIKLVDLQ